MPVHATLLPQELSRHIERKLRLLRREQDSHASGGRAFTRMREQVSAALFKRQLGKALVTVPLEAYEALAADALETTRMWPGVVWNAIREALDDARIASPPREAINAIVDRHAWGAGCKPFTLGRVDSARFGASVERLFRGMGLNHDDYRAALERQLNHHAGLAEVSLLNAATEARERAGIEIDRYLVQRQAEAESLPKALPNAQPRHFVRDRAIREAYCEFARLGRRNYVKEIKRTVPGAELLSDRRIRDIAKGR